MNSKQLRAAALAAALSGAVLVSSCQQFFTTSLAKALARDSADYDLTSISVDTAVDMLATALSDGDADMAAALVTPLLAAATAAATDPASAAYQEAASALLDAAVLSSGVGPAVSEMVPILLPLSLDPQSITPEEKTVLISEAIATVSSISLNKDESDALLLIADNPPEGLSADDAYTAAAALVADAFVDAEVDLAELTEFNLDSPPVGVDQASIDAALQLLTYADSLPVVEGSSSVFADIFSSMGLIAPRSCR